MVQLRLGDVFEKIKKLQSNSVHCIITSPPYWGLRIYSHGKQRSKEMGQEDCIESHIGQMVIFLRECYRVLRTDGTLWLVCGDTYTDDRKFNKHSNRRTGLPRRSMLGIPWRVAIAALNNGWSIRQEIIIENPTAAPGGDIDRPSTSHQTMFLLAKSDKYYYDRVGSAEKATGVCRLRKKAELQPDRHEQLVRGNARLHESMQYATDTRRLRSVWRVPINKSPADLPPKTSHHARFPLNLPMKVMTAAIPSEGCCANCEAPYERIVVRRRRKVEGVPTVFYDTDGWKKPCSCKTTKRVRPLVLDTFCGSGTTLIAATRHNCRAIGMELNPLYGKEVKQWLSQEANQRKRGEKKMTRK